MPVRHVLAGLVLLLAAASATAQTRPATPAAPSPPAAAAPAGAPIDLNSASRDDLMSLDGIGEVRAEAIIRARPFKAKTELVERRLIPEAVYDKIADRVIARPPPGAAPTPTNRPPAGQPRRT